MLAKPFAVLDQRFRNITYLFEQVYLPIPSVGYSKIHRANAMEGALSIAWQTWCGFCRTVLYLSCSGTVTTTGRVILPIQDPPSYGRLGYVAKQLLGGVNIKPGKEASPHNEPTWGDPRVGLELAEHYKLGNLDSLQIGLNLDYMAPEHMRVVRNAVSHMSNNNIEGVKQISVYYSGQGIIHPLDLLTWSTKKENALVFIIWLQDLKDMASEMCR